MKRLVLLLNLFAFSFSNAQTGLLAGTGYAPDFTVTDINGTSHTLYNYLDNGQIVVLEFMSVTCGHCISHASGTEASYQTNGPNGTNVAQFLGLEVNSSTDSTAIANFINNYGASFPIANNISPTTINYQLYYTPGYYVIYPDRSYTTICAAYCVTTQNSSTIEGLLNTAIAAWLPPVYGCTDSLAINFDPLATVDNDSCDYTSYTITTSGMNFIPDTIVCDVGDTINFIMNNYHNAVEVSDSTWIANGTAPLAGGFNIGFGTTGMFIPDDCHTFYYVCQPHVTMGMKGVIIAHHPPVFGCTDSIASNYDSTATIDDGSCTYCVACNLPQNTISITSSGEVLYNVIDDIAGFQFNVDGTSVLNAYGGDADAAGFTISFSTNSGIVLGFSITGATIPSGCGTLITLDLSNPALSLSNIVFSNGSAQNIPVLYDMCASTISGCTDTTACNYNPLANFDDGSCILPDGCTDSLATNYNASATCDNGSCTYGTLAADLFISEYGEGSGYNKYIEIFNGTGQNVDLSNYEIWKITNGGSWPEYTLSLSGNLADGDVYVICHTSSSINPFITTAADITWSQASWTGDDAVGLAKNTNGLSSSFTLIDVIGEDGSDPGNGWDVAGVSDATKDHTLIRKCSVNQGNTNWSISAGTNPADSEWEVFAQNYWLDIGQHTFPCQSTSIYGCTDSTAINYDPLATADDGSCILPIYGCMDTLAFNYDSLATNDDGLCCFIIGCTNLLASNYDSTACYDDGSCIIPIFGCMNPNAMNYDSLAVISDTSCVYLADIENLFFSEYGEGSSNNKWLEIYNPTSQNIDLSSYALARVSNAPTTVGVYEYWVDFPVGAIVLANDVYVVAHASSSSPTPPFGPGNYADWFYNALSNGDDGFALVYGARPAAPVLPGNEYVILDFIGDFNGDPGSGWDVAGVTAATKDHTLIRKCSITVGNDDWTASAGTNTQDSEWNVYPQDDWSNIGQHTYCPMIFGCTDSTAINYDPLATADDGSCVLPIYGCTDPLALNYFPGANINDPNNPCCYVAGCTDPTATNYDPNACYDDGSCIISSSCSASPVDSVWMSDIIHDRATFNWNSMNSATCDVDQMVIRYREVGSSSWTQKFLGNPTGSTIYYGTSKRVLFLSASTTYEYQFKIWYMGVSSPVNWGANPSGTFTTLGECPNVGNFAVSTPLTTRATFTWDDANGVYSFARIKMRVDSISNPTGADWQNVGGFGVVYPTFTRNKNGLTPGETYRGQSRTWCDPAGGPYKSSNWTSLIFWTQPTVIRLEGGSAIANLEVYPNPSRDIFNVTFTSEDAQDLKVRIVNVIGEEILLENLQQFVGEYVKSINLNKYTKGIYFLEITTNNGVVNKKLILQ